MILLLDTTILIDTLRHRHGRRKLLAQVVQDGHTLATTAINLAEVYAGMRASEEGKTEAFLSALECYSITAAVARRAGRMKRISAQKGRMLALDDLLIAAVAIEHHLTLMTDNRKDFPLQELTLYPLP